MPPIAVFRPAGLRPPRSATARSGFLRLGRAIVCLATLFGLGASSPAADLDPAPEPGGRMLRFLGMANASAGAPMDDRVFAAASDEDNTLRWYDAGKGGKPLGQLPLRSELHAHGHNLEADIEGAARVGDRIYWLGSHSRGRQGDLRYNRHQLFATRIVTNAASAPALQFAGRPCTHLLEAILARFGPGIPELRAAAPLPPKSGGINFEGLAALENGGLLMALRSPIPDRKALLFALLNPAEATAGREPRFGDPIRLELDGLGVRDITWTGREYFLLAGNPGGGGKVELFRWKGPGKPAKKVMHPHLQGLNAEAILPFGTPKHPRLLVLSDDGRHDRTSGEPGFRSVWIEPSIGHAW